MACRASRTSVPTAALTRLALSLVLGGLAATALAQTQAPNPSDFMAQMEAAQAAAVRAGDAAMTCDQLEKELVTVANDPALQAHVAQSGALAKQQMEASTAGSGRAVTQTALTIMSAVVPGAAMAGLGGMVSEAEAQKAAARGNISQKMQQAQQLSTVMPQLMRGQRIIELGQARKCDWVP